MFDQVNPLVQVKRQILIAIGLAAALAIALLLGWALRLDHLRGRWQDRYETFAADVVLALREETGNNDVEAGTAVGQIRAMGDSNRRLKISIETQNAAIDQLAEDAVRLKARASELQALADKARAQRAAALRRLSDMSAPPPVRRDYEQLVDESNKALDILYEEGF